MTITCEQFVERSSDYLDNDLDAALAAEARAHAEGCQRCRALVASLRSTVQLLGDENLFAMPEGLHERLQAAVAADLDEPLAPAGLRPARAPIPPRASAAVAPKQAWRLASWALAAVVILAAVGFFTTRSAAITTSGWLIDTHCLSSYSAKLAEHPASCLLKCGRKTAVGVVDAQGHFMRFDATGRKRVLAEVAASHQPDHLWVTVRGRQTGSSQAPVIDVEQVELTPPGTTSLSR